MPMRQPNPRRQPPKALLQRLDRAAAELNPLLTVIMIGLFLLNLMVFAALVPRLHMTRNAEGCLPITVAPAGPAITVNPSIYPH